MAVVVERTTKKLCFVIAPIDQPGTAIRKHSDQVLTHIIRPAAESEGYVVERADDIQEPGTITRQVIERLRDAELVVADLTERNPNVFYELAIRHVIRRPLVQLIKMGQPIPFDVATARTIMFDLTDPDSVAAARRQLVDQIRAVERDPTSVDNPIANAIDVAELKASGKGSDAQLAALVEAVGRLQGDVSAIRAEQQKGFSGIDLGRAPGPTSTSFFSSSLDPSTVLSLNENLKLLELSQNEFVLENGKVVLKEKPKKRDNK